MADRWGPDPTHQTWERWRRPVLVVVAAIFVVNQWDRFSSGEPFVIATGIGVAAFWISVVSVRLLPEHGRRTDPAAWRALARRRLALFGSWTAVALAWLAVTAALFSLRPVNLVVPALPALLLLSAWWTHRSADRFAEVERRVAGP